MKPPAVFVLASLLVAAAAAQDLGQQRPPKSQPQVVPNVPQPRQGGDTIADALPIDISYHFETTGTTTGFTDDYDEVCPYSGSTSPDVVYIFDSDGVGFIDIDMCFSAYDTKIYVYDANLEVVACNDDFYFDDYCGMYVSRIEFLELPAGGPFYLVIDGYGGDHGDYHLEITRWVGPEIYCPPSGLVEGEPHLVDGYQDSYNGGCNSPEYGNPFQDIHAQNQAGEAIFCGVSGYFNSQRTDSRDTDWFRLMMGPTGTIEIWADAARHSYLFELWPQNCDSVAVAQLVEIGPYWYGEMTITDYVPGQTVWIWFGPTDFTGPGGLWEYDYVLEITGLMPAVAVERRTWGAVKALYR